MLLTDACYTIIKKFYDNHNKKKILEITSVGIGGFAQIGKKVVVYFVQDRFLLAFCS